MGKEINKKLWAMILVVALVSTAFVAFTALASAPAASEGLNIQPVSNIEIQKAFENMGKQPLNEKYANMDLVKETGPSPLSPGPGPQTEGTWTYNFDTDTVGAWPADPPWSYGFQPAGQTSTFPLDNFDTDTVGQNPTEPPWITKDGASAIHYWQQHFDGGTIGQPVTTADYAGTDGYFGTWSGGTLTFVAPPAGAPAGQVYAGHASGAASAQFNCAGSTGNNYWGPAGFGSAAVTTAYAGGWIRSTSTQRCDLILVESTTWNTAVEVALLLTGGLYRLYHWPAGAGIIVPGSPVVTLNTWHELMVMYNEVTDTYTVYWDGTAYAAGSAFDTPTDNLDGMIWFAPAGSTFNGYIDNFCHLTPPTGTAQVVNVVNTQSHSAANSVSIDQNSVAAPNIARTEANFTIPMAGAGSWDFWARSDTLANTNGALFELYDQSWNGVIQLRATATQWQYNNAGAWTNALATAATTWYHFNVTFDTVAKNYHVWIGGVDRGTGNFARQSGTLIGVRYTATAATESTYWFDDVAVFGDGAGANISVSNYAAHSGANALRVQEYNAADTCYIGADNLGAGNGAVGNFSFWFYSTQNWGGQTMWLDEANGGNTVTAMGIGCNLVTLSNNPGVVQFVNNDGTGLWVVDGPTYAVNTWNKINIEYDTTNMAVSGSTGSFYYRWNDGARQGPYGMFDAALYLGMITILGGYDSTGVPPAYGDFLYDDFSFLANEVPKAPTNCRATLGSPISTTWTNYTVTADNPVEGTVTGTFAAIDENPPAGDLQSIREFAPASAPQNVSLINNESFENAGFPPAGWTQTAGSAWARTNVRAQAGTWSAMMTGAAGGGENGFLTTPVIDTSNADWVFVDFWSYDILCDAGEFQVQYYDNTGAWDIITPDLGLQTENVWYHFQSGRISDAQYRHANFRVQFQADLEGAEFGNIDMVYIYKQVTPAATYSLEHRWTTQNVPAGSDALTLYVTGNYSTGSNDNFQVGYSTVLGGPYTSVITINSATMTTYSAAIPTTLSGVFYLNVIDSNTADLAGQDTVYLDAIRIQFYDVTGTSTSTQLATADNPNHGTVTGGFALTNTVNAPPDTNAQQITEAAGGGATLFTDGFESGSFVAGGWILNELTPGGTWAVAAGGNPGNCAIWNLIEAYALGERSIVKALSTVGYSGILLNYDIQTRDSAAPFYGTAGASYSTTGTGGPWTVLETFNAVTAWSVRGPLALPPSCDNNANFAIKLWLDYQNTAGNLNDGVSFDDVLIGTASALSLEHRWTMQNLPANAISRTLHVYARYSAGSNDNFLFGWSQTVGGPYTSVITVNSASYIHYQAAIPLSFNGALYINVEDSAGDGAGTDTVYVDAIYVESTTTQQFNGVQINWTLSQDDGGGENDIARYNIYRADQEDADTLAGPYTYIGFASAGISTYIDIGEGVDKVNQAWYYVQAQDTAGLRNASGYFSKLNLGPVTSNVLANGVSPRLTISPGLQTITITATAFDDSSQFEAIPKMNYSEMYIGAAPAYGAGTPLTPVDGLWDTVTEPLTGGLTQAWVPGTYNVSVRTSENHNGTWIFGAPMNVTIQVIDGPPVANANVDQTVPQHTTVMFDGHLSTDDVGITGYWWNFTDGLAKSLSGMYANYTFNNESAYTVTLQVRDTIGQGSTDTMNVTVTDGDAPIANAGIDQTKLKGLLTTFDGTGSYDPGHDLPPDRGIVNWTWTFTDGTPKSIYGKAPTYTFNTPGTYNVTLTVRDPVGLTAVDWMLVTVQNYYNINITAASGAAGGWILISFPNKVSGNPLTILVDGLNQGAGLVTWNIIQRYESNPMAPITGWLTTSTFKPSSLNTFTNVDNTMGFWIHITNYGDGNLAIVGDLPETGEVYNIQLYTGWNLVGYPCMTSQDMATVVGGMLFNVIQTEVYDPTNADGYRTKFQDAWDSAYFLSPGQGFWIEVSADEIWTITCP